MKPFRLRLPSSVFRPLPSVLLAAALALTACTTPASAQQALKVDPDTGQLVEPTTLLIAANQTFTVASNATITLPDASLPIADISGLQTALDARPTFTTANATYQPLSANLTSWSAKAPYAGTVTIPSTSSLTLSANSTTGLAGNGTLTLSGNGTLGSAAYATLGQLSGNVPTMSADRTFTIGDATAAGTLRLRDLFNVGYGTVQLSATGLLFTPPNSPYGLISTSSLTAGRSYGLPDTSGTVALLETVQPRSVPQSGNFTADYNGLYVATANLTVSDPPAYAGAEYAVIVRNGTTTLAGQNYATAGTVLRRVSQNTTWTTYPYFTTASAPLTGNVTVAQGGTGLTTVAAGNLLTGNGTGPVALIAPGTSGNVLTSNGTAWISSAPSGGGGSGNITINTTAPLTVNGGNSSTTSNATLAITFATNNQTLAGASTAVPVAPSSLLLSLLSNGIRTFTFTTGTSVATGTGTAELDSGICYRLQVSNATAGNRIRRNGVTGGIYAMSHVGTSQLGVNWSKAWGFSARFSPTQTWASGNRALITVMKDRTQGFGTVGSAAFFFIEVNNLVLTVGHWNGTTATRTATLATLVANQVAEIIMVGDGAGGLTVYLNGTQAATMSSVPTTNEQAIEPCLNVEIENTGTGTAAWFIVAYPLKFWSNN